MIANSFDSVDHAFATHPDPFATSVSSSPSNHGISGRPAISVTPPELNTTSFNQKSFDNLIDFDVSFDPSSNSSPQSNLESQTSSATVVRKPVRTLACEEFEDIGSRAAQSPSVHRRNSNLPPVSPSIAHRLDSLPNEQDAPPPTSTANPQTYIFDMIYFCVVLMFA